MTTATAPALSGSAKFTVSVKALRGAQGVTNADLCRVLHISKTTLYDRLNGSAPWNLDEAVLLAEFFATPLIQMINGIGMKASGNDPEATLTLAKVRPYVAAKNANPDTTPRAKRALRLVQ